MNLPDILLLLLSPFHQWLRSPLAHYVPQLHLPSYSIPGRYYHYHQPDVRHHVAATIREGFPLFSLEPTIKIKFWLKYWKRVLFSSFVLACLYESHTFPIIVSVNFKGGRISTIFNQDQWPNVRGTVPRFIPAPLQLAPTPTTAILSGLCFCVVVFCTNAALISLQHRRTRMKTAEINMFWTSVAFSATTSIIMIYMVK